MRAAVLGLMAVALLASEGAEAQPESQTANSMFPGCQKWAYTNYRSDPHATYEQGRCSGNIEGLAFVTSLLPANLQACIPKGVILGSTSRRTPLHASAGTASTLLRPKEVAVPAITGDLTVPTTAGTELATPAFVLTEPVDDGLHQGLCCGR
jgi:hypothetical protein